MDFNIARDDLASAVLDVVRTIPARPVTPVLSGILIEADLAAVTFSAYDYERSHQVRTSADVISPDRALVSGKLLAAIAKVLPKSKPVHITRLDTKLRITAGAAEFLLPLLPEEDYPTLPAPGEPAGTIAGSVLIEAIERVAMAAGKDDSLAMLTGIYLEARDGELAFTATDRFRLATVTVPWSPAAELGEYVALVPAEHLVAVARSVRPTDDVRLHLDASLFSVSTPISRSTFRVLDAEFPKYRFLLPAEYTTLATINVRELSEALKRVEVTSGVSSQVLLDFGPDGAQLRSSAETFGSTAELVPADVYGDGLEIKANAGYLLAALAGCTSSTVTIGLSRPNRPFTFHPETLEPEGAGPFTAPATEYRHLVMPTRK